MGVLLHRRVSRNESEQDELVGTRGERPISPIFPRHPRALREFHVMGKRGLERLVHSFRYRIHVRATTHGHPYTRKPTVLLTRFALAASCSRLRRHSLSLPISRGVFSDPFSGQLADPSIRNPEKSLNVGVIVEV